MSTSLPYSEASELDLLDTRQCSALDHEILAAYKAVVDGMAMLSDRHCEIVLSSLEDLKCTPVRIVNGEHTGRKVGLPILDFTLRMLHDMIREDSIASHAYCTRAKNGVLIKSVTITIRNRKERVIGLLCIK